MRVLQRVKQLLCLCWRIITSSGSADINQHIWLIIKGVWIYSTRSGIISCNRICSLPPRISQEDGLGRSSSGRSGSWESPYQPPQPGNQDCRYWIIPELPLLGMDAGGVEGWGSLLGSRTFWRKKKTPLVDKRFTCAGGISLWRPLMCLVFHFTAEHQ